MLTLNRHLFKLPRKISKPVKMIALIRMTAVPSSSELYASCCSHHHVCGTTMAPSVRQETSKDEAASSMIARTLEGGSYEGYPRLIISTNAAVANEMTSPMTSELKISRVFPIASMCLCTLHHPPPRISDLVVNWSIMTADHGVRG